MCRIHLFEFEDQLWFPETLRKGITDYLQYAANKIDLYTPIIPILEKRLEKENTIIDIGSGSGGGMVKIHQKLKSKHNNIKIILTDKYPHLEAYKSLYDKTNGDISYVDYPVDALDIPSELKGLRTQFVSFHHFKPKDAKKILENAVRDKSSIGIFEVTERSLVNFIGMLFTPLVVMIAVPFIRPFSLSRLLFTYLLPIIPISIMWDGLVSVLRTYSVNELKQMTESIKTENYNWEIGKIKTKGRPNIIYVLGYPN